MKIPQWLVGTTDGVNIVISTDMGDMPCKGAIVRVQQAPTDNQINILVENGCNVRVIKPGDNDASNR